MLRERYERIRERALEPAAAGVGSDVVMCRGMRSWMETGWQGEMAPVAPAPTEGRLPPDRAFQQIVAVWASVLVGQAERSYRGQRQV